MEQQISIRLGADDLQKLDELAKNSQKTRPEYIRDLIHQESSKTEEDKAYEAIKKLLPMFKEIRRVSTQAYYYSYRAARVSMCSTLLDYGKEQSDKIGQMTDRDLEALETEFFKKKERESC